MNFHVKDGSGAEFKAYDGKMTLTSFTYMTHIAVLRFTLLHTVIGINVLHKLFTDIIYNTN